MTTLPLTSPVDATWAEYIAAVRAMWADRLAAVVPAHPLPALLQHQADPYHRF